MIEENCAGFEFQYTSLNFLPSRSDYPWCNHESELFYSFIFYVLFSQINFQINISSDIYYKN